VVQVSYPGVYIQEVPSGVRTITGVATSVTAFLGAAPRGPVDDPVTITSFGDYERMFGGLAPRSSMSYAVRDFFANGGGQAVILRVVSAGATRATLALATGDGGTLDLQAASEGRWGARLRVRVDHDVRDAGTAAEDTNTFNLTVAEVAEDPTQERAREVFRNVSLQAASARYLPRVLEQGSLLVRVKGPAGGPWTVPATRPAVTALSSPPASPPAEVALDADGLAFVTASGGEDGNLPGATELGGSPGTKTGLHALEKLDLFNLLCIPPPDREGDTPAQLYKAAMVYCAKRRAMLIVDPPVAWGAQPATAATAAIAGLATLGLTGPEARNAALYFPRVLQPDPLRENRLDLFPPSGVIAGRYAATDAQRGVWKAPAGLDATPIGVDGLQVNLSDPENGRLNQLGINCLRSFPVHGRVIWGARTLAGADQRADEYKYVPVRRTALFLEESLYRGLQWVVFEPNDESLWAQIRLNVGAFMQSLFRQGAFQGSSPREAYLVKCDRETTTQTDINLGIVNILVGFAPLKPAEFVIIRIQQLAGQAEA
jgi:hypothetical protein